MKINVPESLVCSDYVTFWCCSLFFLELLIAFFIISSFFPSSTSRSYSLSPFCLGEPGVLPSDTSLDLQLSRPAVRCHHWCLALTVPIPGTDCALGWSQCFLGSLSLVFSAFHFFRAYFSFFKERAHNEVNVPSSYTSDNIFILPSPGPWYSLYTIQGWR